MGISIQRQARAAQLPDAEAICQLLQEVFVETYGAALDDVSLQSHLKMQLSSKALQEELKTSTWFISEAEQELLGVLKLIFQDRHKAEIGKLYVRANVRAQGVGKELLNEALAWAKQKTLKVLWLNVWEQNLSAIRFYESQGFKKTGRADVYVGEVVFKDFVMEKGL